MVPNNYALILTIPPALGRRMDCELIQDLSKTIMNKNRMRLERHALPQGDGLLVVIHHSERLLPIGIF